MRPNLVAILLILAVTASPVRAAAAGPRAAWHHANSPFRAEFEIAGKPNHPKGGVAVSVPNCNLGNVDGGDFFAFDEKGAQVPIVPLGQSVNNEAIALVAPAAETKRVFVYFGSKTRAPTHGSAFLPSLTADVRTLPEGPAEKWEQVAALLERSRRLGRLFVDKIEMMYNPVDCSDACLVVFDGYLNVPQAQTWTLMLVSDDAGYLFVDDKLLLARDGRHFAQDALRGESRKDIQLAAGPHAIRLVLVDFGGTMAAVVARWINEKQKYPLRPEDFIQPGRSKLVTVEARHRDQAFPAFWTRPVSYMSFNGAQYTEVELGTYNEEPATWQFSDGSRLTGAKVGKVVIGLDTLRLEVTQKNVKAGGTVALSENPPRQCSMTNADDFKRYTALMMNQNLDDMQVSTLRGSLTFLRYVDFNEDMIPFCEAILKKPDLEPRNARDALLDLARTASKRFPDRSAKAYQRLADKFDAKPPEILREYAEFTLFRRRDFALALNLVKRLDQELPREDKTPQALLFYLALQKGDVEEAKKQLDRLLGGRTLGEKQRAAAVQGNALRQRFEELLDAGFTLDAWKVLWEWSLVAPTDVINGSLCLARSRLWQKLGWLDGALGELDGAMLLNPLLPNLPDVEMERARIFRAAGDQAKAKEVLQKIVKEYPNHPVAAEAKDLLK